MLTLAILDSEYQKAKKKRWDDLQVKRERVIAKACELNDGQEPIEDAQGMLHAPCDGYKFTMAGNGFVDGGEKIYAGGEYLPVDNAEKPGLRVCFNRKFLFPKFIWDNGLFSRWLYDNGFDIAHSSDDKDKPPRAWIGKVWFNEKTGYENLFVWLHAPMWGLDHLEAIFTAHYDRDVSEKPIETKPPKGEAPVGHAVVQGRVLVTKIQESMYGSCLKMLVELENLATAWGSMPSALREAEDKLDGRDIRGHTVSFEADFDHAKDDFTHSFFKRPKKAVLIF
jgi:hypothetical protein